MRHRRILAAVIAAMFATFTFADSPPAEPGSGKGGGRRAKGGGQKRRAAAAAPRDATSGPVPAAIRDEMHEFSSDPIRAHMRFLSDDMLEGRGPGTRGEELALRYLASQFEEAGLEPAGDRGTYFQRFPLVAVNVVPAETSVSFVNGNTRRELKYLDELTVTNDRQQPRETVDAELLFVGHGVVAPEFDWDDYKGVDVSGKVLVMLADDPPATAAEPNLFGGRARTYYGRWTYKYEIALAKGAAGAILIHTDESAGYPWAVVRNSFGKERSAVKRQPQQPALQMSGWITEAVARELMQSAGHDLTALLARAHRRDFRPVPLGVRVNATITSTMRDFETANVAAKLTGSDPALRDEYVVYTAHHDHLGIGAPEDGDAIYNGAVDNSSGLAVLLEMARVWAETEPRPKRSILFLTVGAEEQGLLGSEYYAQHPIVPPGKTVVGLNFDSIEQYGEVANVTMLGLERTTFEPMAKRVTAGLGLRIDPDQRPEQGLYYRSDHFNLAKVGIPAFSVKAGNEYKGRSKEWGAQQFNDYNRNRYHQPDDEFDPSWNFNQGVQMARLGYWLGWEAVNAPEIIRWKPGAEFYDAREKSLSR